MADNTAEIAADESKLREMSAAEVVAETAARYAALRAARETADLAPLAVQRELMTADEAAAAKVAMDAAAASWYRAFAIAKVVIRNELTTLGFDVPTVKSLLA